MQLKLHKPTMAIGYSLRMCTRHNVDSTNPDRSRPNLVFRSKPIPEAEMSNRLIPPDDVFYSLRALPLITIGLVLKILGDECMGRPLPQIFGGPSPQSPYKSSPVVKYYYVQGVCSKVVTFEEK